MTDRRGDGAPSKNRRKAAWTLIVLAPLIAELAFSAVGMPVMWLAFPLLVPAYGAGVLLIRELVVRARGGLLSLILMGVVYELVEDGIGLQALTSPIMYNAAEWGPRILGFNTTYWESQIGYHVVFSVLIPVLLTNLIFPSERDQPYLRGGGLVCVVIGAVLGVALLRGSFAATMDPGYQAPLPVVVALLVIIAALSLVALRVLPRRAPTGPSATTPPPSGWTLGLLGAAAPLLFLGLLMPRSNPPEGPAIGEGAFVFIPMAVAAALAIGTGMLLNRWSWSTTWSEQHSIWLAGGALVGHTLFPVITALLTGGPPLALIVAVTTGPAVIIVTVLLLVLLSRRVDRRTAAAPSPAASWAGRL